MHCIPLEIEYHKPVKLINRFSKIDSLTTMFISDSEPDSKWTKIESHELMKYITTHDIWYKRRVGKNTSNSNKLKVYVRKATIVDIDKGLQIPKRSMSTTKQIDKCVACYYNYGGFCRRYPPIWINDTYSFPEIFDDYWCGEFKI